MGLILLLAFIAFLFDMNRDDVCRMTFIVVILSICLKPLNLVLIVIFVAVAYYIVNKLN